MKLFKMNTYSSAPLLMSLLLINTSTNILFKLIWRSKEFLTFTSYIMTEKSGINFKILPSYLLYNSDICLHNFLNELEVSNLIKNKTKLTHQHEKTKQKPHLFSMILKAS